MPLNGRRFNMCSILLCALGFAESKTVFDGVDYITIRRLLSVDALIASNSMQLKCLQGF